MNLALALKVLAPVFVIVGLLHLIFGIGSEVMLGAEVDLKTLKDPVIDSQNRFYGVAFTAYGFLFYLCTTDLNKYQTVLRILLWVFFAAGCARLLSIATHGMPSVLVQALLLSELLLPPLGEKWLRKTLSARKENDNQP